LNYCLRRRDQSHNRRTLARTGLWLICETVETETFNSQLTKFCIVPANVYECRVSRNYFKILHCCSSDLFHIKIFRFRKCVFFLKACPWISRHTVRAFGWSQEARWTKWRRNFGVNKTNDHRKTQITFIRSEMLRSYLFTLKYEILHSLRTVCSCSVRFF
jgi:hypothetical protein